VDDMTKDQPKAEPANPTLVRQPTLKEIEAAVQPTNEVKDMDPPQTPRTKAAQMAAAQNKLEQQNLPQVMSVKDLLGRGNSSFASFGGDEADRARRTFQYMSHISPDQLMTNVTEALVEMGFEIEASSSGSGSGSTTSSSIIGKWGNTYCSSIVHVRNEGFGSPVIIGKRGCSCCASIVRVPSNGPESPVAAV